MIHFPKSTLPAVAALIVAASSLSAATTIRVRETVALESSVVRLGDVAEVACDDVELAIRLNALPLMPAPGKGSQRFLRQREIADLLAAHGNDLASVAIVGAEQVTIASKAVPNSNRSSAAGAKRRMSRSEILLAGHSTVQPVSEVAPSANPSVQVDVHAAILKHVRKNVATAGELKVTCDVPQRYEALLASATSGLKCEGGNAPWTGRQRFLISFTTAKGPAQFAVYADITPPRVAMAVALRPLTRGSVITAADIELQEVDYSPKATDRRVPIDSIESVLGMEAKQPIAAGSILFLDQLQSPLMVKKGEVITISTQGGGFRVRTTARALQDRCKGELVQVESLDKKSRFDACVVGPQEATIVVVTPPSRERAQPIETARR